MLCMERTTTVPSGLKKYAALGQQLWLSLLVSLQQVLRLKVQPQNSP